MILPSDEGSERIFKKEAVTVSLLLEKGFFVNVSLATQDANIKMHVKTAAKAKAVSWCDKPVLFFIEFLLEKLGVITAPYCIRKHRVTANG